MLLWRAAGQTPFWSGPADFEVVCDAAEGVASRLLNILGWSSGDKLGLNRRAVEAMAVNEIFRREPDMGECGPGAWTDVTGGGAHVSEKERSPRVGGLSGKKAARGTQG